MKIKTRMAPSPTGEYHIGHMRTLLYNVAYAKKHGGDFLLRIEDTDQTRYVEGSVDRILDVVRKYGFSWDEGPKVGGPYAPYFQSKRLDIYKKHADELVEKSCAYYCFCTEERLKNLREEQRKEGIISTRYDRYCLNLSKEEVTKELEGGKDHVIRLKIPDNEVISFEDKVYGKVSVNSSDLDDQILIKSDGFPTYHLAVVVDDHIMQVTHILRGNDWIPSTPKHIILYKAFGWEVPTYIHLPNLKEKEGTKKLSKRYGSVYAIQFLEEGYLPEALVNFLMFLGWNPGTEREMYTFEEFAGDFSEDRIHKTDLVSFDRQKLLWYNGYYIRNMSTEELLAKIIEWAGEYGVDLGPITKNKEKFVAALGLVKDRMKKLSEFTKLTHYFFNEPTVDKGLLVSYVSDPIRAKDILMRFADKFSRINLEDWSKQSLKMVSDELLDKEKFKPREAFMTLRIAVSGTSATPQIFDTLEVIEKEKVVQRINLAIKSI